MATPLPKEDAECVSVDAAVVFAGKEFRRHVDGRSDDAAGHHRFRLAETQIRDFTAIVFVDEHVFELDVAVDEPLGGRRRTKGRLDNKRMRVWLLIPDNVVECGFQQEFQCGIN